MNFYCEDCDFVHGATRALPPHKWRCLKAPVSPGLGFVSRGEAPDPPYEKCTRLNFKGECQLFEPRREAQEGSDVHA